MKKILLTLACSFLLSGCLSQGTTDNTDSKNNESENTTINTGDNQNSDNGSENNNDAGNNNTDNNEGDEPNENNTDNNGQNNQNEDNGEGTNDNQNENNNNDTSDVKTKFVNFKDGSFVGQLDQASKRDAFVTYVNGDDNLLSSVSLIGKSESKEVSFGTLNNGEQVTEKHVVWWMGSASSEGKLTMNFNYDVVSIKLSIQAYYKSYVNTWSEENPFVEFNLDKTSKLFIDSEDCVKDLSTSEDKIPEIVDFKKEYTTPTKTITIGNFEAEARVYIHSMLISYK